MVSLDTKKMAENRVIIKLDQPDFDALGRVAGKKRCSIAQAAKTLLGEALDREAEA